MTTEPEACCCWAPAAPRVPLKDEPGLDSVPFTGSGTPEGERVPTGMGTIAELAGARVGATPLPVRAATSLAAEEKTEGCAAPEATTVAVMVSSGSQVSSVAVALMAAPRAPREKSRRAAYAPAFLNNILSWKEGQGVLEMNELLASLDLIFPNRG